MGRWLRGLFVSNLDVVGLFGAVCLVVFGLLLWFSLRQRRREHKG